MKAIVLGMGLQGKAVIHDLESSSLISDILLLMRATNLSRNNS